MAKTRSKTTKPSIDVPHGRDEANAAIAAVGVASREIDRIQREMTQALAEIREAYELEAEPYRVCVSERTEGLRIYAEKNRADLTDGFKTATVAFPSGNLVWRKNPPSIQLSESEEAVIASCEMLDLREFVRYTPALNKQALKSAPEIARNIPGVEIVQGETFVVAPFGVALNSATNDKYPSGAWGR